MATRRTGLTALTVHHATGNGRTRRLGDGNGLYLLIAPRGSKSWLLRTLVRGKRTDIGLGSASLVSLAQAREEALRLRRIARAGGDPLAERRQARRAVPTFQEAAQRVHEAHSATFRNAKHRQQWLSSLTPIFAAIGKKARRCRDQRRPSGRAGPLLADAPRDGPTGAAADSGDL